jgi:hypothetical protein
LAGGVSLFVGRWNVTKGKNQDIDEVCYYYFCVDELERLYLAPSKHKQNLPEMKNKYMQVFILFSSNKFKI